MRPDDPSELTPAERFHEIARILAAGVRRLLPRPDATAPGPCPAPENPGKSDEKGLELAPDLRLTFLKD